jgi:putative flippase GtrA
MKKEFYKTLTPYFVSVILIILIDLIFYYFENNKFSFEELKNASKPAIATLALVITYYLMRQDKKNIK